MEAILEKIKAAHGEVALGNGPQLESLFADYSRGKRKPQQNQLDAFLKCGGNTCILNLRNAPKQRQQTEYHRLIQEMVREYNMQEVVAKDVCAVFWRVAIGTEPPMLQSSPEPKLAPIPKQQPVSAPNQPKA